jgi:hypothetical protein
MWWGGEKLRPRSVANLRLEGGTNTNSWRCQPRQVPCFLCMDPKNVRAIHGTPREGCRRFRHSGSEAAALFGADVQRIVTR